MQFAKDSFFLALQQRLAGLNPGRTVTVNGATVPAILVAENLPPSFGLPQPNTFYIEWGAVEMVGGNAGKNGPMGLGVVISYHTTGTVQSMVDRGRVLGQLDDELLRICQPPSTEKRDYTQSPSADMGTSIFWSQPSFGEHVGGEDKVGQDTRSERKAKLTIYFFTEATL